MKTRPSQSPLQVTYDDLIHQAKKGLEWMERNHPRLVEEKRLTPWEAQHRIVVQKGILRLMERFKRNPQADLFEEFKKQNRETNQDSNTTGGAAGSQAKVHQADGVV